MSNLHVDETVSERFDSVSAVSKPHRLLHRLAAELGVVRRVGTALVTVEDAVSTSRSRTCLVGS